jgi:hypothetical protein
VLEKDFIEPIVAQKVCYCFFFEGKVILLNNASFLLILSKNNLMKSVAPVRIKSSLFMWFFKKNMYWQERNRENIGYFHFKKVKITIKKLANFLIMCKI